MEIQRRCNNCRPNGEEQSPTEEVKTLKIEQESQAMMLCEVIEQKKRAIEDK